MNREEFFVGLRLISYGQNNIPVHPNSILDDIPAPLPHFEFKD